MKKGIVCLILMWSWLVVWPQIGFAAWRSSDRHMSASFEAGASAQGSASFRMVGAYWFTEALDIWGSLEGTLRIELDMGLLDTTDTAFDVGFQPVFRIECRAWEMRPYVDLGAGIHFLSRANIDGRKLGGGHQFSLVAGTGLSIMKNMDIGYRYFHISNANIHSHNNGRDEHLGVITFHF